MTGNFSPGHHRPQLALCTLLFPLATVTGVTGGRAGSGFSRTGVNASSCLISVRQKGHAGGGACGLAALGLQWQHSASVHIAHSRWPHSRTWGKRSARRR